MIADLFRTIRDLTKDDPLFWQSVTWLVIAVAGFASLIFLGLVGELAQRLWRQTIGVWWADRHARRMRRQIADGEAAYEQERKRLALLAQADSEVTDLQSYRAGHR